MQMVNDTNIINTFHKASLADTLRFTQGWQGRGL